MIDAPEQEDSCDSAEINRNEQDAVDEEYLHEGH